ncbi:MAG: ChaN family lipoprotein [Planctomycetota bacterium]|jgi:uncharacterized iron-regulated protein
MKTSVVTICTALLLLTGCVSPRRTRCCPSYAVRVQPSAPTPKRVFAFYDGATGAPSDVDAFLASARNADLVVFGELHSNPVGARFEREVLVALGRMDRPVALAMEFFEADTQAALDAYLAGTLDRAAFVEQTKRAPDYDRTHGPLVDWAKENGVPVIAANGPRRLVSGYRKAEQEYETYLASLTEDDRNLLPSTTTVIRDAYWERFAALMGDRAESFFLSQSLWDDAMAESIADFRDDHPDHRVLLVVGAFHTTGRLGTVTKYLLRRPDDRVAVLTMNMNDQPLLPFSEEDRGSGDIVLLVPPPEQRARPPAAPNPHRRTPAAEGSGDARPEP